MKFRWLLKTGLVKFRDNSIRFTRESVEQLYHDSLTEYEKDCLKNQKIDDEYKKEEEDRILNSKSLSSPVSQKFT